MLKKLPTTSSWLYQWVPLALPRHPWTLERKVVPTWSREKVCENNLGILKIVHLQPRQYVLHVCATCMSTSTLLQTNVSWKLLYNVSKYIEEQHQAIGKEASTSTSTTAAATTTTTRTRGTRGTWGINQCLKNTNSETNMKNQRERKQAYDGGY